MSNVPHFIDPAGQIASILDTILSIAGPNFEGPYQSNTQPHDVIAANQETLIQYQMPGGSKLEGHADPSSGGNIGTAINSMIGLLSPAISAFAMILPILGVIRGIIEILCCLMNPFCVVKAIIRLFKKWIPPFISLFPPLAGVVIMISTAKAIMAIVFYIMTEIVPVIQLIIENILGMAELFAKPIDLTPSQTDAIKIKLTNAVKMLTQKTGVLAVFLPLLDLIFLILKLVSGFPCSSGKTDEENASTGSIPPATIEFGLESDSNCCDDLCPEILSSRSAAPRGIGVVVVSSFCEYAPTFVYNLITGNPKVTQLESFQESREDQLNGCLDEDIRYARPAGSAADRSHIKIKLTSRRGFSITVPALLIAGTTVKFVSPLGALFLGAVNYEIQPDYDMLVMSGIIGAGCHPDVQEVKRSVQARFSDLDNSALDNNPEANTLLDDTVEYNDKLNEQYAIISDAVGEVDLPPFDNQIARIEGARNTILDISNNFIANLTNILNKVINRNINASASAFNVSKDVVIADASDVSFITVSPRDITGAQLIKNIPGGVDINVEIITNFGEVFDQTFNNSAGTVVAKIKSPVVGTASITVKVNGKLITDFDGLNEDDRVKTVRFVSDAALPTRRRRSKPSANSKVNTGTTPERSPGNS